jgi:hypothetical protein
MSAVVWILLAALYLLAFVVLGMMTLRKGHGVLFCLGFLFPFLWLVGAAAAPTDDAVRAGTATPR